MPSLGWSPKHGHPGRGPVAFVVSIWYSDHSPVGSGGGFTAMSMRPLVNVSFRKRITANHDRVCGSYQQRGSLVNSLPPSLNRSLMLNGPRTDVPSVRKIRYAELTGSSTNPLPTHSPWSGGSNIRL